MDGYRRCTLLLQEDGSELPIEDDKIGSALLASVPAAGGGQWFYYDEAELDAEVSDDGRQILKVARVRIFRGGKEFRVDNR